MARQLDLPHAKKVEVLVEVAADLDAVYEHFRATGLSEDEAVRRAETRVVPSGPAANRLSRLHGGLYRALLRRLGGRAAHRLESVLIGLGAASLIGYGAVVAWRFGAPLGSGPALWIVLGIGAAMVLKAVWAGHRVLVRRELPSHSDPAPTLFGLGAASFLAGGAGALLGLRETAERAADGELVAAAIIGRIGQGALLLSTSLAIALSGLALGFLFAGRVATMRRAELEYLSEG